MMISLGVAMLEVVAVRKFCASMAYGLLCSNDFELGINGKVFYIKNELEKCCICLQVTGIVLP